jgi:hypothetical protein
LWSPAGVSDGALSLAAPSLGLGGRTGYRDSQPPSFALVPPQDLNVGRRLRKVAPPLTETGPKFSTLGDPPPACRLEWMHRLCQHGLSRCATASRPAVNRGGRSRQQVTRCLPCGAPCAYRKLVGGCYPFASCRLSKLRKDRQRQSKLLQLRPRHKVASRSRAGTPSHPPIRRRL